MKAERACPECLDGFVLRAGTPPDEIAYDPCWRCAGTGRARTSVYARPGGWRGEWPPPVAYELVAAARRRRRAVLSKPPSQGRRLRLWDRTPPDEPPRAKEDTLTDEKRGAFELEPATLEEFLEILALRGLGDGLPPEGALRRAVCVTRLFDRHSSQYGFPVVRRYVLVAFAYGEDLVTYRESTSHQMEMPEEAKKLAARQDEAYERLRGAVLAKAGGLGRRGEVRVLEGFLHHSADPRGRREGR